MSVIATIIDLREGPNWPYGGRIVNIWALANEALTHASESGKRAFVPGWATRTNGTIGGRAPHRQVALAAADPSGIVIVWRTMLDACGKAPTFRRIAAACVPGAADYWDLRVKHVTLRRLAELCLNEAFDAARLNVPLPIQLAAMENKTRPFPPSRTTIRLKDGPKTAGRA